MGRMTDIEPTPEMAGLQEILMEIARDIHSALTAEDIPYFVIGGAVIGCRRNGRLVPWDDDIDLGIERRYHDLVGPALAKHLPDKYVLELPDTKENPKGYWRILKKDTCLIRDPHDRNCKSIGIEIFDMLDVPSSWFPRKLFNLNFRIHRILNIGVNYVPGWLTGVLIFGKKVCLKMMDYLGKCKGTESGPLNGEFFHEIVDRSCFDEAAMLEVNGTVLPFPGKIHEYLAGCYGEDYMTPPPAEKRIPTYLVMSTTEDW